MTIQQIYSYLTNLNSALIHSGETGHIRDNSWDKYHQVLGELVAETQDNMFNEYRVHVSSVTHQSGRVTSSVAVDQFQRQVYQATKYLWDTQNDNLDDDLMKPELKAVAGQSATPQPIIQQTQHSVQSVDVRVEFNQTIMHVTEALTKAEAVYTDPKSKENKFIKAMKTGLPLVKTSAEIIKLVLETAIKLGLDPQTIMNIVT